jgi:sporulation integral membrane protein YtvI
MNSLFDSNVKGGVCLKAWVDKSYIAKWFLKVAVITVGVYLGFRYFLPLIFPFLIAYFLAWIIRPVTELLYRRLKIPRIIGGTCSLILLVTVFGTALCMLINILIKQAIEFIKNVPVYLGVIAGKLDAVCEYFDGLVGFGCGTLRAFVDENILHTVNMVKTDVMPKISKHTISFTIKFVGFIGIVLIVLVAAVLIAKDLPGYRERYQNNKLYNEIHKVTVKLSDAGIAFIRCQLIIMAIVAVICVLGLMLLKNDYPVLLGIGIAIMDALPVLGSGMVFIPWSIIVLFNGDIFMAAMLFTLFVVCQVVREILEPKLIGNRIGIKPLFTLISIYVGVELFGFTGFFLGPIGLLIIMTIYQVISENPEGTVFDSKSLDDGD